MRLNTLAVKFTDLLGCIFNALEFISPCIAHHHRQTAYISQRMCEKLNLNGEETANTALAANLHDIGALPLEESIEDLRFEDDYIDEHSLVGAHFLAQFPALTDLAPLIKHHHKHWLPVAGSASNKEEVPLGSYVIYLADRVAVMLDEKESVLSQRRRITDYVRKRRGTVFHPDCVDAFLEIAQPEYFWLDVASQSTQYVASRIFRGQTVELDEEAVLSWAKFLSRIVDFRSPLNAQHSSGVAASAATLAELARFSEYECHMMQVAGYLHDIGKLSVPIAILEKTGPLNDHERAVINGHSYYTYRILEPVEEFKTLACWAAFHHERLDGTGYPFRIPESNLPLGSQIMAVADIFTALNEGRTYRPAMAKDKILALMYQMARDNAINGDLVRLLVKNYEEVNARRQISQEVSAREYAAMNPIFSRKYTASRKPPQGL